jgi:hypothetical protein
MTTFTPEELERKTTSKGKPYVRVHIPGQGWVSAWDSDDGNLLLMNPTATFTGEIVQKGDFKNLEQVALASPEEAAQAQQNGSQPTGMSEEGWRAKEERDAVRRLYISHLSNLVHLCEPGIGTAAYERLVGIARAQANSDLLWVRDKATEVPFS